MHGAVRYTVVQETTDGSRRSHSEATQWKRTDGHWYRTLETVSSSTRETQIGDDQREQAQHVNGTTNSSASAENPPDSSKEGPAEQIVREKFFRFYDII